MNWDQLDESIKQKYDEQFADVGGGKKFFTAYRNSRRGEGKYASAYSDFQGQSSQAYNELLSKYGAQGNRIDYKNFSDEKKKQFAADKAAMNAEHYGAHSYLNYLHEQMKKGGGGESPQDPPDSNPNPNPKPKPKPKPKPNPNPPPDNGGGGQNPSPPPSFGGGGTGNQSGNSGHGSGNNIVGDGNAVGVGNVAIGDFNQEIGNSGDTSISIKGSTFGDGASIGNNSSQNSVSNKFGLTLAPAVRKKAQYGAFGTRMAGGLVFS